MRIDQSIYGIKSLFKIEYEEKFYNLQRNNDKINFHDSKVTRNETLKWPPFDQFQNAKYDLFIF